MWIYHYLFGVKPDQQKGQAGIVVILLMIVILTVGLSVASRTSKEVEISIQDENKTRTFSTAESSVEQALNELYQYEQTGDAYDATLRASDRQYDIRQSNVLAMTIDEGYTLQLSLAGISSNLQIHWSENSDCDTDTAALLISVLGEDGSGNTVAKHYAVDGCDSSQPINRVASNDFIAANSSGSSSSGYEFRHDFTNAELTTSFTPNIVRITPIFNETKIRIEGLASGVVAQYNINSSAKEANDETTSILVERTLPAPPAYMNYALVSGASISK